MAGAEDDQLRLCLSLIPSDLTVYGRWWSTPEGRWLHGRVEERIGKPLVLWAGRVYGPRYDPSDVSNSAVEILSNRFIVASLQRADDQWAYLAAILKRELIQQIGGFFRSNPDAPDSAAPDNAPDELGHLTPVLEAIALTALLLKPFTPDDVLPHLDELVYYFAEHGHTGLSRFHTSASQDPALLGLGLAPHQILAVANAILGSRPDRGQNSVLGAYLQDSAWAPDTSLPHTRALEKYASRVRSHNRLIAMAS